MVVLVIAMVTQGFNVVPVAFVVAVLTYFAIDLSVDAAVPRWNRPKVNNELVKI
jgi:MFS superfamily sulfate permease-like transporter